VVTCKGFVLKPKDTKKTAKKQVIYLFFYCFLYFRLKAELLFQCPPKKGLGFSFFVFRCPLLVKSGSVETTLINLPIFAKRLLRGIKVNSSHCLFLFLKLFIACGFGK